MSGFLYDVTLSLAMLVISFYIHAVSYFCYNHFNPQGSGLFDAPDWSLYSCVLRKTSSENVSDDNLTFNFSNNYRVL